MKLFYLGALIWLVNFNAVAGVEPSPNRSPKLNCNHRELHGLDCRLYAGAYNLRLLEKTVAWDDGTWHTVDPLPLVGEGVEWEKIQFEIMNKRPILQMWLWDKALGEAGVQSLHWYVADAEKRKLTILADGVVRKRHLKEVPVVEDPKPSPKAKKSAEGVKPPKPQFLYDAMEPHALKIGKAGQLQWTLGGASHGI